MSTGQTEVNVGFEGAVDDARTSLKWLVAASGAVAALLVAGLQLTGLTTTAPRNDLAAAVISVVVALLLVMLLLVTSARILATPRPLAADLSNREIRAGRSQRATPSNKKDWLVDWILARRSYLLSEYDSVTELWREGFQPATEALVKLGSGESAVLLGKRLMPDAPGISYAKDAKQRAATAIQRVEDAAHMATIEHRFTLLMRLFPVGSIIFVASIVAFAVFSSRVSDYKILDVSVPTEVTLAITDAKAINLPQDCVRQFPLNGVALYGNWKAPVVAIEASGACKAQLLTASPQSGLVAIPVIK